jgi:microcystin-dependent protein
MITMWSGSIASIPAGWLLCDGTSSTPDLRDRFIVGAGSTYAVNATGGANTVTLTTDQIPSHTHTGSGTSSGESVGHTHTGSTGATSISHTHTGSGTSSGQSANHSHSGTTNSENANHTHAFNVNSGLESNDHGHSGSTDAQGAHTHELWANDADGASGSGNPDAFFVASGGVYVGPTRSAGTHSHTVTTGGVSANHFHNVAGNTAGISANHQHTFSTGNNSVDHTHTYSFTTAAGDNVHIHAFTTGANSVGHNHTYSFTTAATGGGLSHENRPPYFALAYIMKT